MRFNFWRLWNFLSRKVRTEVQTEILKKTVERQNFLIGKTSSLDALYVDLINRLHYHDNHLAYADKDEVFSVRRLKWFQSTWYQVHVRGYKDGEVHAHYEVTPEADPWAHYHATTLQRLPGVELAELEDAINSVSQ
jgi:hypothetical protein